ncbi:MAG: Bro-N domain-containing protein [Mariprofundaceae bacterium]|nr:Bro-N domain-containing protein [Mariprofundaceae bacterium]
MSNLQVVTNTFKNHPVRAFEDSGTAWFVAKDISNALGYRDATSMTRMLDDDERGTRLVSTPSGDQEMKTINESGMYHALIKSRKPEAKPFRKWVTSEVLPSIRKTGSYTMPSTTLTPASQRTIQEQVAALAHENKAYAKYYSALKTHFRVGTYKDIPENKLTEALEVLQGVVVEQAALPVPEVMNIPDDMMLVSRMNFEALKNRVNMIYKRHQEMDSIKIAIDLTQAALENVKRDIDKYIYSTNDPVREANMIADAIKH